MAPEAIRFGHLYRCAVHVGVDVGAGDVDRGRRNLYNIHHERPIHRVLGTVQRQCTTRQVYNWTTEVMCTGYAIQTREY